MSKKNIRDFVTDGESRFAAPQDSAPIERVDDFPVRGGEAIEYYSDAPELDPNLDFDWAGEFELWKDSAELGDVLAQFRIAQFYEQGVGVEQSYAKAAEWYDRAAYCGSVDACCKMAELCIEGRGVEQNYDGAAKYLCLIIASRCIDARFFRLAEKLFCDAEQFAPWGVLDALAECYEKGIGTEPDREKAGECREKAALMRQKQDVEIRERFREILSDNG